MKKITALFLSTMVLISIVGCSVGSNPSANRQRTSTQQDVAFKIDLPTFSTTEPTITPTPTESISPTDSASPSPATLSSPSSTSILSAASISALPDLNFGDSVATVQSYAGSDISVIDDGNGDALTYQDASLFDIDHGTLRYGFSSLGQLNRLQFACRLGTSATDTSIEQVITQITSLYGHADAAVLGHTWILTEAERTTLLDSSLAKSSQIIDGTTDTPLLVWQNGQITVATATGLSATPASSYLPTTTLAPTLSPIISPANVAATPTSENLLPSDPIITEDAVAPVTASASGINLLTHLNSEQKDAQTLQTALQDGAYLEYVWKQDNLNIVLSIRNVGSTAPSLYGIITVTPATQTLSATFERIMLGNVDALSTEQIQSLLSSATLTYSDAELNTLFDSNGLAAEAQLQNQGAIITGEIASIDRNVLGQPTITFVDVDSQSHTPIFVFNESEIPSLLSLKKGDSVSVVGVYDSHTESNVTFAHCQLRS